jgi:uncharacterized protein YwqG
MFGWLARLVGGRKRPSSDGLSKALLAQLLTAMRAQAAPCLVFAPPAPGSMSKLGGEPNLRAAHAWPTWKGASLAFLAQIDLAEARAAGGPDWLSERGGLFFFYDAEQSTWGFDPKDAGSWVVLHDPEGFAATTRSAPEDLPDQARYAERPVGLRGAQSLPAPERLSVPTFDLADEDFDALWDAQSAHHGPASHHQIGGHADPIQGANMDLECQLAANGVYCGGPEGYASEAAKVLAPGAADWRLLLQLDSDDEADMMWGDVGRLYFWIREADARAGAFSKAWMVLQCS